MKKKKDRWKRMKVSMVLVSILLFLAIVGLVAVKVFTVKEVVVEGNELYEASVIEDTVLADNYSWNSLYVLIKYRFFQKSGQVPFIDTLEISLKNPHTLHVKVYEKGMLGYISMTDSGENAYIDKDGFVVEISEKAIEGIPEITGLSCEEVELLKKLPIDSDELKDILLVTQKLKGEDLIPDMIQYGLEVSPVLYYNQVKIQLGDIDNLTQKVARMKKILPSLEGKAGTLHLEKWTEESPNIVFDNDK